MLLAASAVASFVAVLFPGHGPRGLSLGTAYAAYLLVIWALVIGPLNVLRRQPNPIHGAFRRDVGIAAGLFAVAHTVVGLTVHRGGVISRYFLYSAADASVSNSVFLFANWIGLFSAIVFAALVTVSNNPSLRSLGLRTWKLVQRSAYPAAVLATIHGIAYQLLDKRSIALIALLTASALVVVVLQIVGFRARRLRSGSASRPS